MTMIHHEPMIDVVRCLGCDERIAPADLYKHGRHDGISCCFWHPYHFWCIRAGEPVAAHACAECGGAIAAHDVETMLEWSKTRHNRVHLKFVSVTAVKGRITSRPDFAVDRPLAQLRLVCVQSNNHDVYEVAHDTCGPGLEDPWRTQLRAAPADDDLRAVYADHLEQTGELPRAEFVRIVIRRRSAADAHAQLLGQQLVEARQALPGSWCRDVAKS